jgi:single-strand DNA-binding protein
MIIVEIAGHLGADVETRVTPDGQKVSTIRVATNVRKGGRDETVWWRVSLWGDRWDKLLSYLTKGTGVIVIGEMQKPEIFNNRDGQPQVSLDIRGELLRFSPFGRGDREGQQQQQQYQQNAPGSSYGAPQQRYQPAAPQAPAYARAPAEAAPVMGSQNFSDIPDEDVPF